VSNKLPLEGVRVADITVVWAGPHVTQLLAEWGAEVIRVEPRTRIQPSTRGAERLPPTAQELQAMAAQGVTLGAFPDFEAGVDWWNRGASFNSHGRNKLSMTADIMTPEGREAFLRLVEVSDVVVENNVPETIEKAGAGWEVLSERNPRLVMLRMPGFGLSGEYKNYRGYGLHMEAVIGHTHIRSYPDDVIEAAGDVVTSDAVAGIQGAFAISMALRHVRRTGRGQLLEQPLAEAFLPIIGEFILDYTANGRDTEPQGNTHRAHAPHNYYPCRNEREYIAIDCDSDEAWAALCEFFDAPELLADERWRTAAGRHRAQVELDRALTEYTRKHDQRALFLGLQAAGVICGPVQNEAQAYACPQLAERGFFEEVTSASAGTHRYPGLNLRMANTPNHIRAGAPLLGEHNDYVYRELLGYSDEEYAALQASELVGRDYAPGVVSFPGAE
jgi:crotonobetainyl-CoA:carnitine CoA-transferase CaiB-like acyl-CoA transferase